VTHRGGELLTAAQAAGTARTDVTIDDLVSAIAALGGITTANDPPRSDRLVRLLLDGVLIAAGPAPAGQASADQASARVIAGRVGPRDIRH
jgi:hypothetical protein